MICTASKSRTNTIYFVKGYGTSFQRCSIEDLATKACKNYPHQKQTETLPKPKYRLALRLNLITLMLKEKVDDANKVNFINKVTSTNVVKIEDYINACIKF